MIATPSGEPENIGGIIRAALMIDGQHRRTGDQWLALVTNHERGATAMAIDKVTIRAFSDFKVQSACARCAAA